MANQQINASLPQGYVLEQYRILNTISFGGFSIVYLAVDTTNDQQVVIKEYLPATIALRHLGEEKPVVTEEHEKVFRAGLLSFFEEGRALAKLKHPNIVQVSNFFRANDTVYLVMMFEKGISLEQYLRAREATVSERFMRGMFVRIMNGLREVHSNKLLHLDIKPANIYLRSDRTPLLIDFGAARQTLFSDTEHVKKLTPIYTPGYASPEQHNARALLGPWSDIYSLGATMYACLTKRLPPSARDRLEKDTVIPVSILFAGQYSKSLLQLIDWAMCLNLDLRPPSVLAMQKILTEDWQSNNDALQMSVFSDVVMDNKSDV